MSDYYQFRDETGTPIDYYQLVNDNNELCKEVERLNKENKELDKICARKSRYIDKKDLEIGRLNNTINKSIQIIKDYLCTYDYTSAEFKNIAPVFMDLLNTFEGDDK